MPNPAPLSRRSVLRAGTIAAAALTGAAAGVTLTSAPAYAARTDIGTTVFPFPLGAVQLLPGPFASNTARTHSYLSFLDADRLPHTFRLTAASGSCTSTVPRSPATRR